MGIDEPQQLGHRVRNQFPKDAVHLGGECLADATATILPGRRGALSSKSEVRMT